MMFYISTENYRIYIFSSKHAYRPTRARVVLYYFINVYSASVLITFSRVSDISLFRAAGPTCDNK